MFSYLTIIVVQADKTDPATAANIPGISEDFFTFSTASVEFP